VSAESSTTPPASVTPSTPSNFGRTAVAILATMLLLIVALTGILVQTTWRNPPGTVEMLEGEPGSFAQR
jgi:hypothetical protein